MLIRDVYFNFMHSMSDSRGQASAFDAPFTHFFARNDLMKPVLINVVESRSLRYVPD